MTPFSSPEGALPACGLEVVWSAADARPHWTASMAKLEPWLASAMQTFQAGPPIPPTVHAFVEKPLYRPPGSHRCVYYLPASLREDVAGSPDRAVLAFKGLEPLAADFAARLEDFRRPCYSPHNIAEHLIFEERRIPGCVGLAEALREATRAAEIHDAHLEVYGAFAHLPVPLFVFRHSEQVAGAVRRALASELSSPAFEVVERSVDEGLGVYVYYFPAPPVRVRDVDALLNGLPFRQRMFALLGLCEPETVIHGWVRLFARMLLLGFLPGTLSSLRTGICCQPQNATIDGGFVDVESIAPLASLHGETAVAAALQLSTDALASSVRSLLTGSEDPTRTDDAEGRFDLHHLRAYVLHGIREALAGESGPGLTLDSRVGHYYGPPTSFDALVERLSSYHASSGHDSAAAARAFTDFGIDLIKLARRS